MVRTSSRLSLAVLEQGFSRQTQRQFAAGSSGTIHFDKNSAFVPTIPYPSKQNQVHPSLQQVRFVKILREYFTGTVQICKRSSDVEFWFHPHQDQTCKRKYVLSFRGDATSSTRHIISKCWMRRPCDAVIRALV